MKNSKQDESDSVNDKKVEMNSKSKREQSSTPAGAAGTREGASADASAACSREQGDACGMMPACDCEDASCEESEICIEECDCGCACFYAK